MSRFTMVFETDDSTMLEDPDRVPRVLSEVSAELDRHDKRESTYGVVRHANGEIAGRWSYRVEPT